MFRDLKGLLKYGLPRLFSRLRVCLKCGATYHVSMLGGKTVCDKCGDPLVQRNDDKAETVLNRLEVYHAQTAPLIDYYAKKGILKNIDGAQGIEEVYADIMKVLK